MLNSASRFALAHPDPITLDTVFEYTTVVGNGLRGRTTRDEQRADALCLLTDITEVGGTIAEVIYGHDTGGTAVRWRATLRQRLRCYLPSPGLPAPASIGMAVGLEVALAHLGAEASVKALRAFAVALLPGVSAAVERMGADVRISTTHHYMASPPACVSPPLQPRRR